MFGEWTDREKKLVIALSITVLLFLGVLLWKGQSLNPEAGADQELSTYSSVKVKEPSAGETTIKGRVNPADERVVVDVKGAVHKPGIYQIARPARLYQVIQSAGGATQDADLSQLNLAQEVMDGSVLYVPKKGEKVTDQSWLSGTSNSTSSATKDQTININTATVEQLQELNGIGPSKAAAIVQYREQHGPFRKVGDVAKVPGIGEKLLGRFQSQIGL